MIWPSEAFAVEFMENMTMNHNYLALHERELWVEHGNKAVCGEMQTEITS